MASVSQIKSWIKRAEVRIKADTAKVKKWGVELKKAESTKVVAKKPAAKKAGKKKTAAKKCSTKCSSKK